MEACLQIIGPSVVRSDVVPIPPVSGEVSQVLEYCESQLCSVYQGQRHDLGTKKGQLLSKAHRNLQKLCLALQRLGPQ